MEREANELTRLHWRWAHIIPNYRNRTKVSAKQRVCADCGAVVGHRLAGRR